MRKIFYAFLALFLLAGCELLMFWQKDLPDCALEEKLEEEIEEWTGYDIDLSPLTGKEDIIKNSNDK